MRFIKLIEFVIKVGVDVNLKDKDYILLILVCEEGNLWIVVVLIDVGVDVNFKVWCKRLIIVVCMEGYFDVVKYLI